MTKRPAIQILRAAAWADDVAGALAARVAAQPDLRVCLPTGATPGPVYDALPGALVAAHGSFGGATVVLLDEYLDLPAGHPARCDTQLRRMLVDRLDPAPARLITFGVDGIDPAAACVAFDAAIDSIGGLDLVVLGLGMNGHVGMNEPGTPADAATRVVDLAPSTIASARDYGADPVPTRGVTLGMAEIRAAREIWLLVSGARKAAILAATLSGPVTSEVPASLLREHPGLRIIVDDAAAAGDPA
jgi:6-phosphogluconolactonase/glucosamine-6-phosphate isomerase/deaminase